MGCDIHLFTERKKTVNDVEKWVNIDNFNLNPYYEIGNTDGEREYVINSPYRWRNYTLFSMLADVRNYEDLNIPISQPKGLPNDVTEIVKSESERWGSDGHSHSYLTMQELYDYLKENNIAKYSGLVDKQGSDEIDKGNMPEWWCKASNQDNLIYREWEQENTVIKNFIETLESHFESFYYNKVNDASNYRIVFWFDN